MIVTTQAANTPIKSKVAAELDGSTSQRRTTELIKSKVQSSNDLCRKFIPKACAVER